MANPSVKIALIGLDHLTGSIGLGLKERAELRVIGFDRDPERARLAQARGLVHQTHWNLPDATDGADVVLLGGPLADQPQWLEAFAPALRESAVVASLGPLLVPPLNWAAKHMPAGRHFVAAHPILNPALLHTGDLGLDGARKDLFSNGLWALADAPNCAPEALKLLGDLATLLGAGPYFVDAAEHDGLMGGVDALPMLAALALLRAANASPGWNEMRKVADRGFATATLALANAEADALLLNRESVLRYLDAAINELQATRELVASGKRDVLEQLLAEAATRRAQWQIERAQGNWDEAGQPRVEMPTFGESMSRMLTGGLFRRKKES
ncbi:MAG: prephenate dehydrogenase [Anaerolineales bacterium]